MPSGWRRTQPSGREGGEGHGLGRRHGRQVRKSGGGGLLGVWAVHVERPGLPLLGRPEGPGAGQRHVAGADVLTARVGAFTAGTGAEVGEEPPQPPAEVEVVVEVVSNRPELDHWNRQCSVWYVVLMG